MREAAELADDVAMLGGVIELQAGALQVLRRHLQRAVRIEFHRQVLIGDGFAVLERQHDERLLDNEEAAPAAGDQFAGKGERLGVAGERLAALAVDLARKLIEHDDEGDLLRTGQLRKIPRGRARFIDPIPPRVADVGIDGFGRPKPIVRRCSSGWSSHALRSPNQ